MNTLPLVSVIIPCLNRVRFIMPTIESVLRQDYPRIECIVVDGGSTDGSLEILKRYEGRIRWVSEPDNGHADAINKGFRMSKGDILAWLNADDLWVVPSAVSQAAAYLQTQPEVDIVYGDCGAIDANGDMIGWSYLHTWDLEYALEYCDYCIPQPASFIQRRILEKVGWLDTKFISKKDHELWLRAGLEGQIRYAPVLLAYERICSGYLARRGDITAIACVDLTKKFFLLPGIPEDLARKKKVALINAHLRGIEWAWSNGRHWRIIIAFALRATLVDPTKALKAIYRFMCYVVVSSLEHSPLRLIPNVLGFLSLPIRKLRKAGRSIKVFNQTQAPVFPGDRDIEWSWIVSEMPTGPGEALDLSSDPSGCLALIAADQNFNVIIVNPKPIRWTGASSRVCMIRSDIPKLPLPKDHFDLMICCLTVEHMGLVRRHGAIQTASEGDFEAMARLHEMMKTGGIMLLTLPVGQDCVLAPSSRTYGKERLPRLLERYVIEKEVFWVKDLKNRWTPCDKEIALSFKVSSALWNSPRNRYALGGFVLRKLDKECGKTEGLRYVI